MRFALYPFASTSRISYNLQKIEKAAALAAEAGVRLLVFHECALCGYPPVEAALSDITEEGITQALDTVSACARRNRLYIAVGTVRFAGANAYNAMVLFDAAGTYVGSYDKEALWGWDCEHFARGSQPGIFTIDGIRVGFRICFDIRFPESFRKLYRQQVQVCFVAYSDTLKQPDPDRYQRARAFLMTRAMENTMTIASVNSLYQYPAAPNAVFDPNGLVCRELPPQSEELLVYSYEPPEIGFGMRGRIENNRYFLGLSAN